MSGASELSPAARLIGILFDGGVSVPVNREGNGAEVMSAGTAHGNPKAVEFDDVGGHDLGGDRGEG